MAHDSYLVDTNVLLRLVQPDSSDHEAIRRCVESLWVQGAELFYTTQNMAEFWNVCTRPASKNGFGFSLAETNERARRIEQKFELAFESESTHKEWRRLVVDEEVSGVQVHDARLVAAMLVHGIERLLTLNLQDFRRYRNIVAVSPHELIG